MDIGFHGYIHNSVEVGGARVVLLPCSCRLGFVWWGESGQYTASRLSVRICSSYLISLISLINISSFTILEVTSSLSQLPPRNSYSIPARLRWLSRNVVPLRHFGSVSGKRHPQFRRCAATGWPISLLLWRREASNRRTFLYPHVNEVTT